VKRFVPKILATAAALVVSLALPALASASQSFEVSSPTGFPAGGDPSYTTTQLLDSSHGSPGKVKITLAPGVLASLAANPSCLKSVQYTSACQIGTGSASTAVPGVGVTLTAYLVPPPDPNKDAAGIDLVTSAPGQAPTHVAVALVQTANGNVESVLNLDLSGLGPVGGVLTNMSLTVNGTLDGKPFTRMPTNCTVSQHSSLTVTYSDGTTETSAASPDFVPSGCSSLPFTPVVSASVIKDAHDDGAKVTTTQTQPLGQAAGASTTLQFPWPALASNTAALSLQNTTKAIGTAVATSPLQPAPLTGFAYLTGPGPFTPTLTLKFVGAVSLTLVGNVSLQNHTVTFPSLPDVPQTALVVTLFGGSEAAESASCSPAGGILKASNTGQNGVVAVANVPFTVVGCPKPQPPTVAPSVSGAALGGLAGGRPALSFTVTRGSSNLKSLTVSLPAGLRLKSTRGVSVSRPATRSLHGGRLTISLKGAASSVHVRISPAALIESTALERRVRAHKAHPLQAVRVTVTDAGGGVSTLTL
jgi:hypothetical protein